METNFVAANAQSGRYARQIGLDGFGPEGQQRLRNSHVAVSRCGGVGGTVAMHLARAGVGQLTIAHGGTIELEALNRMPLAFTEDVGRPASDVHAGTIARINPDVRLHPIHSNITEHNVVDFVRDADVIVDGAPLFEERYLMNREAVRQKRPLVTGAMYATEGCVTTIVPGETPCFACLNPASPDYWNTIYVFPAISPVPAMVGAVMAMEVIKLITGCGEPLYNKLWFFDMHTNISSRISVRRRSDCEVCGDL
jgi:molybdopterin-synthase adenylyltransferase